jgi:hypothetical protein
MEYPSSSWVDRPFSSALHETSSVPVPSNVLSGICDAMVALTGPFWVTAALAK